VAHADRAEPFEGVFCGSGITSKQRKRFGNHCAAYSRDNVNRKGVMSGSDVRELLKTTDTTVASGGVVVPVVRRLIGGTTVPPTDHDRNLPSCKNCGSFALYRDGSCMTCEGVQPARAAGARALLSRVR
jgi:hypothetical protein